jgi:DNA-damage-inducible protein J
MAATAFVRARIDEKTKDKAAIVLAELGLTVSDVVRMTLTKVAREGGLPFELKIPNAETKAAMEEARALVKADYPKFSEPGEMFQSLDKNVK